MSCKANCWPTHSWKPSRNDNSGAPLPEADCRSTDPKNKPMPSILRTEATIEVAEYMRHYRDAARVQGYCKQCPNYNHVWGCPPFDFDEEAYLSGYATARIFASQIEFDAEMLERDYSAEERKAVMTRAIDAAWDIELPRLYALEAATPGSLIFTGRCRLCRPAECARASGKPCRHPDRLRHSLESLGFDLEKTSRDLLGIPLQWASGHRLPPYITLITAIFTPSTKQPHS